jgi:hypothetical protein
MTVLKVYGFDKEVSSKPLRRVGSGGENRTLLFKEVECQGY